MLVTCPSGLRGNVREWTVADEDVLVESMGLAAQGKMLQGLEALIRDSWVETIDPGPYGNMPKLDLEALSREARARETWTFLFVAAPLPIEHGTGSAINPLAIF